MTLRLIHIAIFCSGTLWGVSARGVANADPLQGSLPKACHGQVPTANGGSSRVTQWNGTAQEETWYVPVLFHVLLPDPAEVTTAQIHSQLTALNRDFNGQNEDLLQLPPPFEALRAAVNIRFFLADTLLNASTRGVSYVTTETTVFTSETLFDAEKGGSSPVQPDRLLNVWVADLAEPFYGFTTAEGVGVDHRAFGTEGTLDPSYQLGRTLTHELGHYFSLQHPWGNGGCDSDDGVEDTPNQAAAVADCSEPVTSCGSTDMSQNFMNLAPDDCLLFFTAGQKMRMRSYLATEKPKLFQTTPPLILGTSTTTEPPRTSPNPVPAGHSLQVTHLTPSPAFLTLSSLNGQLIKNIYKPGGATGQVLDVSSLPSGIYLICIVKTPNEVWKRKIIIQ